MAPNKRRYSFLLLMFKVAGFPLTTKKIPLLQSAYNVLISVTSYSVFLAVIYYACNSMDNLRNGMTALCYVFGLLVTLWAEVNYRIHMKNLDKLLHISESFTWEELPVTDPETGELTLAGWMPRIVNCLERFTPFAILLHLTQSFIRVVINRQSIFDTLYPFDTSASPIFEFTVITEMVASLRYATLYMAPPYMFTCMVGTACTQLQKVNCLLLEIKQRNYDSDKYSMQKHEGENIMLQKKFNEVVGLHQQVLSYIKTMEKVMSNLVGGVLFFLLLAQCTAAFAAVMTLEDINELSRVGVVYIMGTAQAFIYCSFGSMLSLKYESVSYAAWDCDWVGTPVSFQRCVSFMISLSNRGFTLTAAKFVPISNATLMNMINESMSLFMFLLTMKEKNE